MGRRLLFQDGVLPGDLLKSLISLWEAARSLSSTVKVFKDTYLRVTQKDLAQVPPVQPDILIKP